MNAGGAHQPQDAARSREQQNAASARACSSDAGAAKAQSEKDKLVAVMCTFKLSWNTKIKLRSLKVGSMRLAEKNHRGLKKKQLSQRGLQT